MRAGLLALVDERDRHLAEPLGRRRVLLEQLAEPDRAREPRRAAADDQDADLDALVGRVGRRGDHLGARERRRIVRGANLGRHRYALRARTSSASFGTTWFRSPTTPKSAKSKIGAFGSLLIATIVPEFCMPDLVLDRAGDAERDVELRRDRLARLADLRRVRVPAGIDDRARRRDRAAERGCELLGELEALGRAEAAAAGDDHLGVLDRGPARLLVGLLDHLRGRREVLQRDGNVVQRSRCRPSRRARRRPSARARSAACSSSRRRRATVSPRAGRCADELAALDREVGDVPVEPGVESRREPGCDVGREDGGGEEDVLGARRRRRRLRARRRAAAAAGPRTRARRRRRRSTRRTRRQRPRRRRRRARRRRRRRHRRARARARARRARPSGSHRRGARGRRACVTGASSRRASRRAARPPSRRPRS